MKSKAEWENKTDAVIEENTVSKFIKNSLLGKKKS